MIETLIAPENEIFPGRKRITRTMCQFLVNNGLLDERYELVDGVIISKMPINPPHRITVWLIGQWLIALFGTAFVQKENGIVLPGDESEVTEPQPDLVVTLAPTTDYLVSNPGPADISLIVEVSDSTLKLDLNTKALLYARVGIPEYWIMDINGRRLHRHRLPAHDGYGEIVIFEEAQSISPLNRTESVRVGELLPPVVTPAA